MARPFKSAGRHACNCLIPSRHAISHSTIQVIPEVTPEASALFLNNSTSGLHARWRYLVYPILAPDRELLVLRFGFLYHGGRLFCQNTVNQAAISKSRDRIIRSEEHTSELQSPCNLVCRLLLEKKKQK